MNFQICLPQECQHLRAVFQANGYPTHVVDHSLRKHPVVSPQAKQIYLLPMSKVPVNKSSKCLEIEAGIWSGLRERRGTVISVEWRR